MEFLINGKQTYIQSVYMKEIQNVTPYLSGNFVQFEENLKKIFETDSVVVLNTDSRPTDWVVSVCFDSGQLALFALKNF